MNKKITLILGLFVLGSIACEWFYFQHIYYQQSVGKPTGDVVLVHGGRMNRSVKGLKLANQLKVPLFVSEVYGGPKDFQQKIGRQPGLNVGLAQPNRAPRQETSVQVPITVDHFAKTTDQNARNAVRFLKNGSYHRALLVTNWYHMPRAVFLTRVYLWGSSIHIEPYYFESVPKNIFVEPDFWAEMFRFWGSLVRVALAEIGFEKPIFHYFD